MYSGRYLLEGRKRSCEVSEGGGRIGSFWGIGKDHMMGEQCRARARRLRRLATALAARGLCAAFFTRRGVREPSPKIWGAVCGAHLWEGGGRRLGATRFFCTPRLASFFIAKGEPRPAIATAVGRLTLGCGTLDGGRSG